MLANMKIYWLQNDVMLRKLLSLYFMFLLDHGVARFVHKNYLLKKFYFK